MEVKILEKSPLPLADVHNLLVELEKKGELSSNQQKIRDFTAKFNKLNKDQSAKLIKELEGAEVPRLTKDSLVEIVNLLSQNESELRTVFMKNKTTVTKENVEKILTILKNQ